MGRQEKGPTTKRPTSPKGRQQNGPTGKRADKSKGPTLENDEKFMKKPIEKGSTARKILEIGSKRPTEKKSVVFIILTVFSVDRRQKKSKFNKKIKVFGQFIILQFT